MNTSQHLLFVHIPKTAGTSFRLAAKQFYGEGNVFFDYAPESIETSSEIIDAVYSEEDLYKFYKQLTKLPSSFLSGHFPANKYMMLYDTTDIVSFVRDPLKQIVSHYNHHVKHLDYQKTLSDFVMDQRFQNLQSRLLSQRDIGMYGFLGITEQYDKSIEIFNTTYHTNLKSIHENKVDESSVKIDEIDEKLIGAIHRVNDKDVKFYKSVCQQFDIRKKLHEQNKPFTYGMIQKRNKTAVIGCAFQSSCDDAVDIDIYYHDKKMTTIAANLHKPGLANQGVPRRGFIGFHYHWKDNKIDAKDIRCIVKETGQEIL